MNNYEIKIRRKNIWPARMTKVVMNKMYNFLLTRAPSFSIWGTPGALGI